MRILAIRGSNLTSFAGDFALELDRPPLDRLGLFAISGATGAGKSTLLDALCLALFDRTPRLAGGSRVMVGRADEAEESRISASDVRGLLRRGAGKGHAEVDFVGRDGRRYRASWTVRRARERADGRLQMQELSLVDVLTGQLYGRTKGEVLQEIQERLGLSFDQFRRSALLAQGEFAAFLRADANERAELLERMTGTEVYSLLSMAAHKQNAREQEELARLTHGIAAIRLLGEAEREIAAAALARAGIERTAAEARLREAEQARAWYRTRGELVLAEAEADDALRRAVTDREETAPREALLRAVREAERFRPMLLAVEVAEQNAVWTEEEQRIRVEQAARTRTAREAGHPVREAAEAERATARAAEVALQPELEAAAELDSRRRAAEAEAREAANQASARAEVATAAREAASRAGAVETAVRSEVETALAWRTARASWVLLATEWPRWQRELERYAAARNEERAAIPEVGRLEAETERLEAEVAACLAADRCAAEAEAEARTEASRAEAALDDAGERARRELREALSWRRDALGALLRAQEGVRSEGAASAVATAEVATWRGTAAGAAAGAQQAAGLRATTDAMLGEARRAQSRAEATQSLASHRSALQSDAPCPLCGALEHPYATDGSALEGLVAEAAARVAELEAEREAAAIDERAASVRRAEAQTAAAQAESRREAADRRQTEHRDAWRTARARWLALDEAQRALGIAPPPEDAGSAEAAAWAGLVHDDVQARLATLAAEEEAAALRARTARAARDRLDARREQRAQAAGALQVAEGARVGVRHAHREATLRRDAAREATERVLAEVALPFASEEAWQEKIASDPAVFLQKCGQRVAMWRERVTALDAAQVRLARAETEREKEDVRVQSRDEEARAAAARATEQARILAALSAERASLLGGRPTAEVRAALRQRREAADEAHARALQEDRRLEQEEKVAAALAEDAIRLHAVADRDLTDARTDLQVLLHERGTTREALSALLAHDAAWCDAESRALDAFRDAESRARAVSDERCLRRTRHEAAGPPALGEGEVEDTCARLGGEAEILRRQEATLRAHLQGDDAARARHGAESRALEARREEAGVWKTLGELIGSHDGKKFKVFAQSLTLDALLLHANAHLCELARRYRLQRVPGHDLDLQVVDGDMGDEVRSVASLSGGETFLVSLALALGLASLSSETTQVDTLFIDEGFGTLDPETLEVALATLDALQATGRQVGIISHVSGLAERIGAQVRVVKQGGGRSRLVVEGEDGIVVNRERDPLPLLPAR